MNIKDLLIGIAFLIGAFLLYKMRKWDFTKGNDFIVVNKMRLFNAWLMIALCIVVGIVYIIHSF